MNTNSRVMTPRNVARLLLLAFSLVGASGWISGCAGPAYRHNNRVERRVDRREYVADNHYNRVDRRVHRRHDRWDY